MNKISALSICALLAGCAPQHPGVNSYHGPPVQRPYRPVYLPPVRIDPPYMMPGNPTIQTDCITTGQYTSCTSR